MWRGRPGGVSRGRKPLYDEWSMRLIESMLTQARPDASVSPPQSEVANGEANDARDAAALASCDYCGSARLAWRKCKLICEDCRQINKSCADL
jgi:hypothetical protein